MKHDLYIILIDALIDLYSLHDVENNTNALYKYIYIKCSICKGSKKVEDREIALFILEELNISLFIDNQEDKIQFPYVKFHEIKYPLNKWSSEFMETFKFRAEFEGEMNLKEVLEEVYLKGYRRAIKFKETYSYQDYIKYHRLLALNNLFSVSDYYSMGVDGFANSYNHNPYKRTIEETLKMNLASRETLISNTTTHITEAELEDYLVDNLSEVEPGLEYIGRQVAIEGGLLDIVARDVSGQICVIEIKVNTDKSIIWQALHYPSEARKKYKHSDVRMITLVSCYPSHILDVLKTLDGVETMEYDIRVCSGNIVGFSSRHI